MTYFYKKFKELCEKQGISESRAAVEMGLASSAPYFWKNGKEARPDTIKKVADYFGVDPSEFTESTGEKPVTLFYARLSELCQATGISENQLATLLGLASSSAFAWRNGTVPRAATLKKIADFFHVEPAYFSTPDEETPPPPELAKTPETKGELYEAILKLSERLNDADKEKTIAFIKFLMENDKKNADIQN